MAVTLEWTEDFAVGIPEIDEQHKVLFQLVGRLADAIKHRRGTEACLDILGQVLEYTRIHFSLEESLMRMAAYDGLHDHKKSHELLIADVVALSNRMRAGNAKVGPEWIHFLRVWLINHIQHSDRDYATYFRQMGFGAFHQRPPGVTQTKRRHAWWRFW